MPATMKLDVPDRGAAPRPTEPRAASGGAFVLVADRRTLVARGCAHVLAARDGAALAGEANAFLAAGDGVPMLVGALPYERDRPAHLYQPAQLQHRAGRPLTYTPSARPPRRWSVKAVPTVAAYRAAVAAALSRMTPDGALRKVVLSRSLLLEADAAIDADALLARLARDESVAAFRVPLPGGSTLIGATPELLLSKDGAQIVSHPLAGSARRHADPASDRAAAQALAASDKDRREHREVVEAILDQLLPYCAELGAPEGTTLTATTSMWHLGTRIVGRLRDASTSSLELASLLHPTPAVCGSPREAADRAIAELEGYDRGFYAGAVGWCDARGNGAWYVALRCAEVDGRTARLYAGAGIVPGSDPASEAEETSAKFAAMLGALGIDEAGHPLEAGA